MDDESKEFLKRLLALVSGLVNHIDKYIEARITQEKVISKLLKELKDGHGDRN